MPRNSTSPDDWQEWLLHGRAQQQRHWTSSKARKAPVSGHMSSAWPAQWANNKQNSYFDYWGLYFDKELRHQAMIYNLHKKKLEEEDLSLFE